MAVHVGRDVAMATEIVVVNVVLVELETLT